MGKINAISISNTKKITATKKNFIQKGSRVIPVGSNPHSKGLLFSRSLTVLNVRLHKIRKTPPTIKHTLIYKTRKYILAFLTRFSKSTLAK